MKYQFCIRFNNIDVNSAASKAVLDCNKIFHAQGYTDYTLTVGDNSNKKAYYLLLGKELLKFFFGIKRGSVVGIQYPLLSINQTFKHFVNIARLKKVRFYCIVHDLESLRTGGKDAALIKREADNLNQYDRLIVHNQKMRSWLINAGVTTPMVSLQLFDYLAPPAEIKIKAGHLNLGIVYAGNLRKSTFIYLLHQINKNFNLYGPGFDTALVAASSANLTWCGEFSPDVIPQKIKGSFGLIWDGASIDRCDEILGNYLKYNNPHKCSLYIAAGLPVIAPEGSAIGDFIIQHHIGVVVQSLHDLNELTITGAQYNTMLLNIARVRDKVINGVYFTDAIHSIENELVEN